jgi:exodeoxyribonuclease V alpha subunit
LTESIASAKQALTQLSPALSTLPSAATTLHREVAARPRLPNGTLAPLDVELVVLDEVSMVDLAMMRRLLDVAVPVERLILLGDPHQLASVQAGAVLAEICTAGSCPVSANGEASGSFGAHLVELTHSYRFSGEGGIGQLASLTRSGDAARAWTLLSGGDREVAFVDATTESADALIERVLQGYGELLSAATPREALERLGRFRMLCAHRKGRYGVTTWNERVQQRAALWRKRAQAPSFIEPILITVNSRDTSLSNGDLGVLLREPYQPATPTRAWFRIADRLAQFSTSRLPAFEPAYAMSIHKSQGSEVDEVLILLPDAGSPLLTRELLYTAITRARRRCTIVGSRDAFCRAVERRVERRSGLAESLAAASLAAHEQRQS